MELTLQILTGLVALICLSGEMNILIKGAHHYLPVAHHPSAFWMIWLGS